MVFLGDSYQVDRPGTPSGKSPRPGQPARASTPAGPSASRPAPSQEQHSRQAALAAARQKSAVPMVLAIVGAIGAIALIIVGFWLYNNPVVKVWDPETGQYVHKRVSRAEASRLRQEERERKERLVTADDGGSSADDGATRAGTDGGTATRRRRDTTPRYTGPNVGEVKVTGDDETRVTDIRLNFADVGATGTLTARLRNSHSAPMREASAHITVVNEDGGRRSLPAAMVRWVPPGHYMRFSVPFRGLSPDDGYGYEIRVNVERAPDMLCWAVSTGRVGQEILDPDGEGVIELDGRVRNRSDTHAMIDPKVIADFYKPNWYHERSATGTLIGDKTERIGPGESALFRIRYTPERQFLRNSYEYQIRLIGKKGL
jgi:hypothetical protein